MDRFKNQKEESRNVREQLDHLKSQVESAKEHIFILYTEKNASLKTKIASI